MADVAAQITDRVLRRIASAERALDQLMPLVHDEDGARQRSVVELRFVGGLSAEETAEVRAVSPITRGLDPTTSEYLSEVIVSSPGAGPSAQPRGVIGTCDLARRRLGGPRRSLAEMRDCDSPKPWLFRELVRQP